MTLQQINALLQYSAFSLFLLLLFYPGQLKANESSQRAAQNIQQANINALMVFTSQEGLSSGRYRFTDIGLQMDVYHLPFLLQLDVGNEWFNMFVMGNFGYSRTTADEEIDLPQFPAISIEKQLNTYTGGLGSGVRLQTPWDIDILTGIELIYSRTGVHTNRIDTEVGGAIEDFFKGQYNSNLTYKLLLQLDYKKIIRGFTVSSKFSHAFYETKTEFDVAALASFSTQASVSTLGVAVETPHLFTVGGLPLTLEGYLNGNLLGGDIVDAVAFDTYSAFGIVAYLYTDGRLSWAERFFVECNGVDSNGLDGYNIGVGFTLDW